MGFFDKFKQAAGASAHEDKKHAGKEIVSPISGELVDIVTVNDEVFSKKIMGEGIAIIPLGVNAQSSEDGETSGDVPVQNLEAPISGELSVLFPTGHAFGIDGDGFSVMVHAGIDTVELEGKGFQTKRSQGDTVKQGDVIVEMDPGAIKEAGYDPTVMVIITEALEGTNVVTAPVGPIKAGEKIIWFE